MNEQELIQNYVEDQTMILHGLKLLRDKFSVLKNQTKDEVLKAYYKDSEQRIEKLVKETTQNILKGYPNGTGNTTTGT